MNAMKIAIVGGGPAGLRAAEIAAQGGASVTVYEAKPSVGRKFLVAGRGGLNLTKSEPTELFTTRYRGPGQPPIWPSLIGELDPEMLRNWARELGVETFVASTGRVYPSEMKAAPLLRRWVARLRELGVRFLPRHRWTGLQPGGPAATHLHHRGRAGHRGSGCRGARAWEAAHGRRPVPTAHGSRRCGNSEWRSHRFSRQIAAGKSTGRQRCSPPPKDNR